MLIKLCVKAFIMNFNINHEIIFCQTPVYVLRLGVDFVSPVPQEQQLQNYAWRGFTLCLGMSKYILPAKKRDPVTTVRATFVHTTFVPGTIVTNLEGPYISAATGGIFGQTPVQNINMIRWPPSPRHLSMRHLSIFQNSCMSQIFLILLISKVNLWDLPLQKKKTSWSEFKLATNSLCLLSSKTKQPSPYCLDYNFKTK